MKRKLKDLIFTLIIFLLFLVGKAANLWNVAEFVAWFLFIMVTIKLFSALKTGIYYTYRIPDAPQLKIEENETRWVFWVLLGAEFCAWIFSIWLCYLVS